jgi:hypothetical protein
MAGSGMAIGIEGALDLLFRQIKVLGWILGDAVGYD